MQIINMPIGQIRPYANNPRNNAAAVEKVAESIKEFGFKVPIIVDKNNEIIAGHTRLMAAQRLGLTEAPVLVASDLTPEQVRAFRIADNKVAEAATWDDDKLAAEIAALQAADYNAELTGFDRDEILGLMGEPDIQDDDDFDPDAEAAAVVAPVSQPGDIWHLGRHRLICGDATDAQDLGLLMAGRRVRLVLTDPPYNVALYQDGTIEQLKRRKRRTDGLAINNDRMDDDGFYNFLLAAFSGMLDAAEPGTPIYVFHADMQSAAFHRAFTDAGWKLAQCLVWAKNTLVMGRQDYQWKHEKILYGWKEGAAHRWYGGRDKPTVLDIRPNIAKMSKAELRDALKQILDGPGNTTIVYEDKPGSSALHPTMKPLRLVGRLLANSSRPDDIVLDPFGGSGTTLIAADKMGRICYMAEEDPVYSDVIVQRWEAATGMRATREARA